MAKWLKITLIVVVVVVAVISVLYYMTASSLTGARKISDKFVADIQTKNVNEAYNLTTSDFKKAASKDQLQEVVDTVAPNLQGTVKTAGSTIKKDNNKRAVAVFVYTITTSNGTKYIRVVLQENDNWQVQNFRSSDTPLDENSTD